MSMGLLGALGGLGEGLSQSGQMMAKSALEEARERRLEEAKMRAEERALVRKYGKGTDFSQGTAAIDDARALEQAQNMIPIDAERAGQVASATAEGQFPWQEKRAASDHNRNLERDRIKEELRTQSAIEKAAAEGREPAGATELNHAYRVISQQFGGEFDNLGNMIKPPDAPEKVEEAYRIVVELMEPSKESGRQPMSLGQATAKAVELVGGHLGEKEAQQKASELSGQESFGWFGRGRRREWESDTARRLMEESREGTRGLLSGPAPDHEQLLSYAQQAIDMGAPADAVRRELMEMGVPESAIPF